MAPIQNEREVEDMNESDMDEPMPGSQSIDSEAPLTHNSSKSNFFAVTQSNGVGNDNETSLSHSQTAIQPSSLRTNTVSVSGGGMQARDSPMGHSKYNPQYAKGSPHNLPR
jgi:hypothetical protein